MVKTSATHPLRIDAVDVMPGMGRIGITFAPGKNDRTSLSGPWARDLDTDLDIVAEWGASTLVTLIEPHEFPLLAITALGDRTMARGIEWVHRPIKDVDIPSEEFERAWPETSAYLRERLAAGKNIVVHCRGGLGRAGMISARLLVESGVDPNEAVSRVRAARPGTIQTDAQKRWAKTGKR
jgi:ADP-ribosyl-[dinitrogen reductase] hydrolase